MERARFAFDIYDFEGKARMDLFYLGDCLRGLNLNPTLKMIEKLGGTKKKGEKFLKLEEVTRRDRILVVKTKTGYFQFYPVYKEVKNSKDTGSFEDFIECLKLYDKMENGTMMLGELEHILLSLGKLKYYHWQGQDGQLTVRLSHNSPTVLGPSRCCCCPAQSRLQRLKYLQGTFLFQERSWRERRLTS